MVPAPQASPAVPGKIAYRLAAFFFQSHVSLSKDIIHRVIGIKYLLPERLNESLNKTKLRSPGNVLSDWERIHHFH